jgi:hypothetical protein
MHLDTETVIDLMEGRLAKATQQEWLQHADNCSRCSIELQSWQNLSLALKRSHLYSASDALLEKVQSVFQRTPQPADSPTKGSLRQILATLVFDSFNQPAIAGARGQTATRQVVMRAEEFDIHVRIWATNESRQVLGQIQPRGTNTFIDTARLHLLQNGERVSSADVNELGEFHFDFVPAGLLSLQIDLPHLTVIGALDVSEKN